MIQSMIAGTSTSRNKVFLLGSTLVLIILISLIISLRFKEQWLWMDEVLSYTLLSDPSWAHMNSSIVSCLDANPPLFFNLYWPIGHWFSMDPLFLKTVSIILFALAVFVFYRYTTSLIDRPIANFVIFSAGLAFTFLNYTLSTQIRTYSWYLLLCCFFLIAMHRLLMNPGKPLNLLVHLVLGACLVLTHNFGLFYVASSMGLFGLVLLWSKEKAYWKPIISHLLIFSTWLLLWYANFQVQSEVGKPFSWIPVPTFTSFFRIVGDLLPTLSSRIEQPPMMVFIPILRVSLVIFLFAYLAIPKLKLGFEAIVNDKKLSFYLLSGYVVLSTLFIALTISLTYKSVFLSRYLWANHFLFLFQAAFAYDYYSVSIKKRIGFNVMPVLALYAVLITAFMFYQSQKLSLFPSKILAYLPALDKGQPVFFESADYFLPIWHHHLVDAHYLLDRKTAIREDNLRNATNDYNVINSLRTQYNVGQAVQADQFNKGTFDTFYVVDESSRILIEPYISSKQVKVLEEIPVDIEGHRILKCSFQGQETLYATKDR